MVCLLAYVVLTLTMSVAMFVRSTRKRNLIRLATTQFETGPHRDSWNDASTGFRTQFGDARALAFLKNHYAELSPELIQLYRRYKRAHVVTLWNIAALLFLALFGYRFCG